MRDENPNGTRSATTRVDTILNVLLVAGLWVLLSVLDVEIEVTIVIVTIGAVFGPEMLNASLDRLRSRGLDRERWVD